MKTETQRKQIFNALKHGDSLTPLDALQRFGCMRLGARIYELREMGIKIIKETVKVGDKHVARYSI